MPDIEIIYYCEDDGKSPVNEWMEQLKKMDRPGYVKCAAALEFLRINGLKARRPHVDYCEDDIFELRTRKEKLRYRLLFFYYKTQVVVIAHSFVKKSEKIPPKDLKIAKERKDRFMQDPERHTYEEK